MSSLPEQERVHLKMSETIACRACGANSAYIFSGTIIDETVRYYECETCQFIETEQPHWLDKAYADAINDSDTGLVSRNIACANITALTLLLMRKHNGRVVDFAGGYGLLTRLLRDMGFDAQWSDPFCKNLVAKGFEHDFRPADLVTAFEAFEHFVDPITKIEKMFSIAPTIFLSTLICPTPTPAHEDWWYYGKEHGQHVSLYRIQTLELIAKRFNAKLITNGIDIHILTQAPFPEKFWRYLLTSRIRRLLPLVLKYVLIPKTRQDHDMIAAKLVRQISMRSPSIRP